MQEFQYLPLRYSLRKPRVFLAVWAFCGLGLDAEDLGKLSGNKLGHAVPNLVAWFPLPQRQHLRVVVSPHSVNVCENGATEALGKSDFWNVNPFLSLGQPHAEQLRSCGCSCRLGGKKHLQLKKYRCFGDILLHHQCLKLRKMRQALSWSALALVHYFPLELFFFFAFMWCLSLKAGNTRRGCIVISTLENRGSAGTAEAPFLAGLAIWGEKARKTITDPSPWIHPLGPYPEAPS